MNKYLKAVVVTFAIILVSVDGLFAARIPVLKISNNKTKSWVEYSLSLDDNCHINEYKPIWANWRRPSGSKRNLKFFERRYYGIRKFKVLNRVYVEFTIGSLRSKKFMATVKDCKVKVFTHINGKFLRVKKIHLISNKNNLFGFNGQAVITGIDQISGETVKEVIKK